jgi:elongation factor G
VSYRETINKYSEETVQLSKNVGGVKNNVKITLAVKPKSINTNVSHKVRVIVTQENDLGKLRPDHLKAIEMGVTNALDYGPILAFPVMDVSIDLLWFETTRSTSLPMIRSAATQCITNCLKNASPILLEPFMRLEITTPEKYIGSIISDLSNRRSNIGDMQSRGGLRVINSVTPLSELVNYSTFLRTLTSGTSTFTMEFDSYHHMNDVQQKKAIQQMTGFAVN